MNRMIAITIRPGATTAAARLICPFAWRTPPPAAAEKQERPEHLGEQPPVGKTRIVEFLAPAELERQHAQRPGLIVIAQGRRR